ncbi:MAG: FG-GAP repeat domain-containing protein, partial [bacterium]
MQVRLVFLLVGTFALLSCDREPTDVQRINSDSFKHHYVVTDLPGEKDWGYGTPALADFDGDGDLDYAFGVREDSVYWYETLKPGEWARHVAGPLNIRTLGGMAMDVDGDDWTDIVIGGY